jgi:hypothetical protein
VVESSGVLWAFKQQLRTPDLLKSSLIVQSSIQQSCRFGDWHVPSDLIYLYLTIERDFYQMFHNNSLSFDVSSASFHHSRLNELDCIGSIASNREYAFRVLADSCRMKRLLYSCIPDGDMYSTDSLQWNVLVQRQI